MKNIPLLLFLLLLTGCAANDPHGVSDFYNEAHTDQDKWLAKYDLSRTKLIGLSKEDVLEKLGKPHQVIDKNTPGACQNCGPEMARKCAYYCDERYEIWEYRPYRNMFGFKFLLMQIYFTDGKVESLY